MRIETMKYSYMERVTYIVPHTYTRTCKLLGVIIVTVILWASYLIYTKRQL